jgi:hypothetical protein
MAPRSGRFLSRGIHRLRYTTFLDDNYFDPLSFPVSVPLIKLLFKV